MQLHHPDKVDIVEQFICEGMEAKHSCEKLKNAGPPEAWNQAKDTTPYEEEDLVTTAAQLNNLFPFYKKKDTCETSREDWADALREYLKDEHNKTIMDFEKTCLSEKILDDFKVKIGPGEQNNYWHRLQSLVKALNNPSKNLLMQINIAALMLMRHSPIQFLLTSSIIRRCVSGQSGE